MEPADRRVELLALVRRLELAAVRTDGVDLPLPTAVPGVMLHLALAQSKQYRKLRVEEKSWFRTGRLAFQAKIGDIPVT